MSVQDPGRRARSRRRTVFNVFVASLLLLGARLSAAPATQADVFRSAHLSVDVQAGVVTVNWSNTPGNSKDWVSVVPAGKPADYYDSNATYTDGNTNGSVKYTLAPGQYEARLYYNDGYVVQDHVQFPVAYRSAHLSVDVQAGVVTVNWSNTPGNSHDWVSVVPAGKPADYYDSNATYTDGNTNGSVKYTLAPGNYEARLYYNDGYVVQDHVQFPVGPTGSSGGAYQSATFDIGALLSGLEAENVAVGAFVP